MRDTSFSITLNQLVNFHKLAETRHFTEAARQLYITQPTLSASIKALEGELGVPLVYREGRRNVRLTPYGEEFDSRVAAILDELGDAVASIRSRGNVAERPLSLGTIPTIQYDVLPTLLRHYWEDMGYDKKVHITVEFSNALVRGLKDQTYDAVFCSFVPEEPDIEFIPLIRKPLVGVIHRDGPYAHLEELDLTMLGSVPFVTYREWSPIGHETRSLLDGVDRSLEPMMGFDDEFMLAGFVSGRSDVVGVMLDTFEIDPFKEQVRIVPIKGMDENWHVICLAYDRRIMQGKSVMKLVELVRAGVGPEG